MNEKAGRTDPTGGGAEGQEIAAGREELTSTPAGVKSEKLYPRRIGRYNLRTVLLVIFATFVLLFIVAYLSIRLEQSTPYAGATYPWTVTYEVLFPDGKQVYIGSTSIMALSYQDEIIIDVDGKRDKMVVGEERLISERRAVIKALGIPIADTNYQMYVRFLGRQEKNIRFYLTIKTSQQVNQFLIDRILPGEIQAKPA
ncbi:MAG: hypothetical protein QHG99_07395 [Methanomicrobiales archaeon]|nr:hypothetical protein [Methanomicrobiales archaeon]